MCIGKALDSNFEGTLVILTVPLNSSQSLEEKTAKVSQIR